jgi:zinc transport system ATP-binding protein
MNEHVFSIRDLSFSYGNNDVLNDVSFDIEKGDFVGIVGPNGSAKSTLLKLMLGLLKPKKGTVKLFGVDIDDFHKWDRIGYISQNVREFNPRFPATVEEVVGSNLYSQLGFFKVLKKEDKEKIDRALDIVDMKEYKNKLAGTLSGGQKQRMFIARAIVNNPEVLVMDEPLVGIDINSQEKFYDLLEYLNENLGITLVMVSHDIGVITNKVNKLICVGNGKVYAHNICDIVVEDYLKKVFGDNMNIIIHRH